MNFTSFVPAGLKSEKSFKTSKVVKGEGLLLLLGSEHSGRYPFTLSYVLRALKSMVFALCLVWKRMSTLPILVWNRVRFSKGASNNGYFLNSLKTLFRLSRALLDI